MPEIPSGLKRFQVVLGGDSRRLDPQGMNVFAGARVSVRPLADTGGAS